jgi:hypothetical protein
MFVQEAEDVKEGSPRAYLRGVKALLVAMLTAISIAAPGCADGDDATETSGEQEIAGDADPDDVEVIRAWADTLRSGNVEGAADYFAIPSVVENGAGPIRIDSAERAVAFNASLPCGAELIRAESEGEFTTATFRLTERPGPGQCGSGTGETAETAFVIEGGKIVEWRRVALSTPSAPDSPV